MSNERARMKAEDEQADSLRPYTVIVGVGEQTGTPDPMGPDVAVDEVWAESIGAAKAQVFEECEPDEDGDMVDTDGSPVSIRAIYAGHHQDLSDKPADAPEGCFWVVGQRVHTGGRIIIAVSADNENDALNRFDEAEGLVASIANTEGLGREKAVEVFGEENVNQLDPIGGALALPADLSRCPGEPIITQSMMERARKAAQEANDEPTPGAAG